MARRAGAPTSPSPPLTSGAIGRTTHVRRRASWRRRRSRWKRSGAAERANAQLFLTEFCDLLGLPRPDPAQAVDHFNAYVFERTVQCHRPDDSTAIGRIDLYRRRAFVLETKQGVENEGPSPKLGHVKRGTAAWDLALERAYHQACGYVKDLSMSEGRPPFVIVCDVGHCFELYAEFTCTGGTYIRFPDPHRHRITLDDLRLAPVRERLRAVWLDPLSLDPSRHSVRVTRQIAEVLASLARSLEKDGHDTRIVASFHQRCLFSLFAEDTGLLPERAFTKVLERCRRSPQGQVSYFEQLCAVLAAYRWDDIELLYAPGEHIGMAYADVRMPGEPRPDEPGELVFPAREAILTRLANLNKARAAEEAAGLVRYLRPDFQNPGGAATGATQTPLGLPTAVAPASAAARMPWPTELPAQAMAVRQALAASPGGITVDQLAARFTRAPKPALAQLLATLAALGQASCHDDRWSPA